MEKIKIKVPSEVILLPGGKDTNFVYQVTPTLSDKYVEIVNAQENLHDRVTLISQLKSRLVCIALGDGRGSSRCFLDNLILLDDIMPNLVAKMLVYANLLKTHRLSEVVDFLDHLFSDDFGTSYCKFKIKRLLYNFSMGMTKEEAWGCNYLPAMAKFPSVPSPLLMTNEFLEFVYSKTYLENIDEKKYEYGMIEPIINGKQLIRLNLQLKFRK
jgi:hypothetical protein